MLKSMKLNGFSVFLVSFCFMSLFHSLLSPFLFSPPSNLSVLYSFLPLSFIHFLSIYTALLYCALPGETTKAINKSCERVSLCNLCRCV